MDAAGGNRDTTAVLLAYRHGLRANELVALRWDDIDFQTGKLHVRRSKGGTPSVHPIGGRELRALRRLQREGQPGRYVFVSEHGNFQLRVPRRRQRNVQLALDHGRMNSLTRSHQTSCRKDKQPSHLPAARGIREALSTLWAMIFPPNCKLQTRSATTRQLAEQNEERLLVEAQEEILGTLTVEAWERRSAAGTQRYLPHQTLRASRGWTE